MASNQGNLLNPGQYIACVYDGNWWLGLVLEYSEENQDYHIKFMTPKGPSRYFKWPIRDDILWVPQGDILCIIEPLATKTGKSYKILPAELQKILCSQ